MRFPILRHSLKKFRYPTLASPEKIIGPYPILMPQEKTKTSSKKFGMCKFVCCVKWHSNGTSTNFRFFQSGIHRAESEYEFMSQKLNWYEFHNERACSSLFSKGYMISAVIQHRDGGRNKIVEIRGYRVWGYEPPRLAPPSWQEIFVGGCRVWDYEK